MYKYNCLNNIAEIGLKDLGPNFAATENVDEAEVILVRSAAMHDMEFSDELRVLTISPLISVPKKVSLFSILRAPTQTALRSL